MLMSIYNPVEELCLEVRAMGRGRGRWGRVESDGAGYRAVGRGIGRWGGV